MGTLPRCLPRGVCAPAASNEPARGSTDPDAAGCSFPICLLGSGQTPASATEVRLLAAGSCIGVCRVLAWLTVGSRCTCASRWTVGKGLGLHSRKWRAGGPVAHVPRRMPRSGTCAPRTGTCAVGLPTLALGHNRWTKQTGEGSCSKLASKPLVILK